MSPIGSYVSSLTSKGQVAVLLGEHRGWILRMAALIKGRLSDNRPEAFAASFQTSEGEHQHAFLCIKDRLAVRGMKRNLLTKIKCFLSLGEIIVHPNLGALNKPSLTMVKKNYSSSTFAFIGILPLPGHSRFVKIYLTLQSLPAFYFSLQLLS